MRWNQRSHEEGWTERRRRFQKKVAETIQAVVGKKQTAPAAAPETRGKTRDGGGK